MSRHTRAAAAIGLTWASLGAAAPLAAQNADMEAAAEAAGVQLPDAYFQRVREQPDAFRIRRGWTQATRTPALEGRLPVVVVPALFSNSAEPRATSAAIADVLFGAGERSLTSYYRAISGGRLEIDGTVVPWVRTSLTVEQVVGSTYGLGGDARIGEYLRDALSRADAHIDFARYDNDGPDGVPDSGDDDGFVDAVAFEFSERAASCGGPAIWPHRWTLTGAAGQPFATADVGAGSAPIRVDDYIIQGATACDGVTLQTSATMAHEMGHVLGLPDLYHPVEDYPQPSGRRWVLGCWALMAAGSWDCGTDDPGPSDMSPWSKSRLGWIEYVDVGEVRGATYELRPVRESGRALRVPLTAGGTEFLVLEYRPRVTFDRKLPAEGVLIYHEDANAALWPDPTGARTYHVWLVDADGDSTLLKIRREGGNLGEPTDAWAKAGEIHRISGLTHPSTRLNSGEVTTVTIHWLEVQQDVAFVRLSTAAAPRPAGPAQVARLAPGGTLRRLVEIHGGAPPYVATVLEGPAWLTVRASAEYLYLEGTAPAPGLYAVLVRVQDALGAEGEGELSVRVESAPIALERLLQPYLLTGAAPSADEEAELDAFGNGDGRYDVGDLRAYLLSG